jgi:Beta-propeller repeat
VFREIADIGTGESKPFTNGYTFAQFFDSFIWVPIIPSSQLSVDGEGDLLIKVQDRILRQVKPLIYQTSADGARHTIEGHYVLAHGQFAFSLGDYDHSRALISDPTFVYSTYLGGSGIEGALTTGDMATAVAVDGAGDAYVTGITMSPDFPTYMPLQSANEELSGRPTAFVAKLNAAGSAFVYSSYLGGSGGSADAGVGDCANAIAVDGEGNAYVAGQTSSPNFPTAAAFQSVNPSMGSTVGLALGSAFVTKLNSSGSALIYSTYLGGSTSDAALAVAVDASGDAYLSGYTTSSDFPIANALQPHNATGGHGANAFVTKFNPTGSGLIYSTYLGGSTYEQANGLALDAAGNAYIAGTTYSNNFPIVEALQATNHAGSHNANNAFISVLNPSGSTLEFSTYLGGSGLETSLPCPADLYPCGPVYVGDSAAAIAVDSLGNLYVTGLANSTDFPTVAAIQTRPTAIFVTKIAQGQQSAPPIVHAAAGGAGGGGGALGWSAISMLGFAVAMRRGRPRGRICDVGPP